MNEKIKSISILGCGWLGFPLAIELVNRGYKVKGSTTTQGKLELLHTNDIEAFLITPETDSIPEVFFDSDCIVITIPPGKNAIDGLYSKQISGLLSQIEKSYKRKIIFTSSISVYGNPNKEVFETDELHPETNSAKVIVEVEEMLMKNKNILSTILRLAGLVGPGREPGKFFAGKQNIPGTDSPVNLVHLDDYIGVICEIINQDVFGEVFNVCCEKHPTKNVFYTKAATSLGLTPPTFSKEINETFKIVNSEKIKNRLNYKFKYPDPVQFI